MKKIKLIICCLTLLLQCSYIIDVNAETQTKSITFNERLNAYECENVTLNEWLKMMDTSGYNEIDCDEKTNGVQTIIENFDGNGTNLEVNATTKYYQLSDTMKGVMGENVNVYFNIVMNIKYVTYNGTKYVQLVSFNNGSKSLKDGIYEFASGCGSMNVSVSNGGATLSVNQLIQLQTTVAISSSQTIGSDWYQYNQGTTSNYYYRSSTKYLGSKMNLPLYSVVA